MSTFFSGLQYDYKNNYEYIIDNSSSNAGKREYILFAIRFLGLILNMHVDRIVYLSI